VRKNILFRPTGDIEQGARRQEIETGLSKRCAIFAIQALVQLLLELVKVADVACSIFALGFAELIRSPVASLLLLRQVLPKDFLDLVTRSLRLQALVRRMDEEIYGGTMVDTPPMGRRANPVSDQITLLNTAFARG